MDVRRSDRLGPIPPRPRRARRGAASTGPAWLDVAHSSSNLALRHGSEVGQRFAAAYTRATGVAREPYWEVMGVLCFLPPPGRKPMFDDPAQLARLEEHLVRVLR